MNAIINSQLFILALSVSPFALIALFRYLDERAEERRYLINFRRSTNQGSNHV